MKTRGKDLSLFDKGRIIGFHQSGKSTRDISGMNVRTIQRAIACWKQDGEPSPSRAKYGRHSILDDRDRRSLKRLVKKNRRSSTQMLTSEFSEGPKKVSQRTVRRELKKMHLSKCKSTRKPLVSAANRKKRMLFAKEHKNWTVEDWKLVMWSDESRFTLFQNDGRVRVWRQPHKALDPSCVTPTVQASGGSMMIWGCFCWNGHGSAPLCSNKMNSQDYLQVLGDHVYLSMDLYFPEGNGIFQDDNARIHRARIVQD